jgi:hypothetical protein
LVFAILLKQNQGLQTKFAISTSQPTSETLFNHKTTGYSATTPTLENPEINFSTTWKEASVFFLALAIGYLSMGGAEPTQDEDAWQDEDFPGTEEFEEEEFWDCNEKMPEVTEEQVGD